MKLGGATVAVTGATGFLGRYLVQALIERGARVVGVVRTLERGRALAAQGVELRGADLAEREHLATAFAGVDAVISNAALLSLRPRAWQEFVRTNVDGTVHVFEAMAAAGVQRAVQISSVSAYREYRRPAREDHPLYAGSTRSNRWNAYGLSKALSERAAWRLAKERGIALTALRPSGIYGAFDRNFTRIHKILVTRLPVTLYPVFMRICLVYAGDVADAAARALENPIAEGQVYNVPGDDLSTWAFAEAWARQRAERVSHPATAAVPQNLFGRAHPKGPRLAASDLRRRDRRAAGNAGGSGARRHGRSPLACIAAAHRLSLPLCA